MTDPNTTAQAQFMQRVERRLRFMKTLKDAGLGLYLPAEEHARKHAFEQLARLTARQSELPLLNAATLAEASELFRSHLESMQGLLPHDVQYRNRIRRPW